MIASHGGTAEPMVILFFSYDSNENVRQLQMYNPHLDCEVLRTHPETFEQLRSEYHLRRE